MTLAHESQSDKAPADVVDGTTRTTTDGSGEAERKPTPEQAAFLDALEAAMDSAGAKDRGVIQLRLSGGPGVGKSFVQAKAAAMAAEAEWCVFMIGPTHQATGVLAAAVPIAFPFEPDPKNMLEGGQVMYCTAHRLGGWVQKSRARQAAQGVTDPVARDSWLGKSLRASWDRPPQGCLVLADEMSMYPGQMADALQATLRTLQRECGPTVLVASGDPAQLTPVRGPSYVYTPGEGPETPSPLVIGSEFKDYRLTVNVRAKDPLLRNVVETYLHHKTLPLPPDDTGAAYGWTEANENFYQNWAEMIDQVGTDACVMLGYRRATVAFANERMCRIIHGTSSAELSEGRTMRVQQTYSPRMRTLAASSDLVEVEAVRLIEDEAMPLILPPRDGHQAAHDPRVLKIIEDILKEDTMANGPLPVATVRVRGDRAGLLRDVPVQVMTEADGMTHTETRWAKLEGAVTMAAFRRPHPDATVRRGLAAIHYFIVDSAKLNLEAPYAMTSHRAQGSTYAHVAVMADSQWGGRIVDHRVASARDASTYVMLSRPSESLTIAWAPRPTPIIPNAAFSF